MSSPSHSVSQGCSAVISNQLLSLMLWKTRYYQKSSFTCSHFEEYRAHPRAQQEDLHWQLPNATADLLLSTIFLLGAARMRLLEVGRGETEAGHCPFWPGHNPTVLTPSKARQWVMSWESCPSSPIGRSRRKGWAQGHSTGCPGLSLHGAPSPWAEGVGVGVPSEASQGDYGMLVQLGPWQTKPVILLCKEFLFLGCLNY